MNRHFGRFLALMLVALVGALSLAAPPALDQPLIKGVSPTEGQAGRQVLITGVNFGSAPEVRFDGQLAAVEARRPDLGQLIATTPAGTALGLITIAVTNTDTAQTSNAAGYAVLAGTYASSCTISGSVTDGAAPVEGALVIGIEPVRGILVASDTTDSSGGYSLALDPAGDFNVEFIPPAGTSFYEAGATVVCSGVQDHSFASGHLLSGRVLSAASSPIENSRVVASNDAGFDAVSLSDSAGRFSLRVPTDTYDVLVEGPIGGRAVSTRLASVSVSSDTDLGDISLAEGVLVEGMIRLQDGRDSVEAMNAFVGEYDVDGTMVGATSSIADGAFFLPSPSGDSYSLSIYGDRNDIEELAVFEIPVGGDLTLDSALTLYSRAGQLPWRPALTRTDSSKIQVAQRIIFDAAWIRGSSVSMLFPDGLGGYVEGLDTLAEADRGGVATTVPALAVSGDVLLRVDGVESQGYPLELESGTFDPGPYSTSGVIDDSSSPVENVFVAMLRLECGTEVVVDYDLSAADGSYSVDHGAGDHVLVFLPPVSSGLARTMRERPGLSGSGSVDVSLAPGHEVLARCVDSSVGVVGGSSAISDCSISAAGMTLDHEDDALGNDGGNLRLNLPSATYEFEVSPPPGSRFIEGDSSEQTIAEDTDFGDVGLDSGYLVEGRIVDPLGNGLPGVEVSAVESSGGNTAAVVYSTDQHGRFLLAVPPSSYDLYFEVPADFDLYVAPIYGLEVSSDYLVYPAVTAEEVGFIQGNLSDALAEPVGGAPVKAWHETYGVVDETSSCADGSYSLRAPTGVFTVQALPAEAGLCLADEYFDNHYSGCGADNVSVTSFATTGGIDFTLDAAGRVSGWLSDDSGAGTAGATVCADAGVALGFCASVCVLSRSDGSYSMPGVPVGSDYKVQAFRWDVPTKCWDDHVNCVSYDPVSVTDCSETSGIDFLMSGAPGPVPDGDRTPGTMMTAEYDEGNAMLTVHWQNTCNADNHLIYFGALGNFSEYTAAECAIGLTGSYSMPAPADNLFYVVVGSNESREGSYGVDSSLAERPEDGGVLCGYTQDLSASCVP